MREIELYTVVNAATDPELAALALSGELHRVDDERDLAVPFVYHDPRIEAFVLVVPHALAHHEFDLRERWIRETENDQASPAPAYVRAYECVLGRAALRARVDEPAEPGDDELHELGSSAPVSPIAVGAWVEPGMPAVSIVAHDDTLQLDVEPQDIDEAEVESLPPEAWSEPDATAPRQEHAADAMPAPEPGEMTWRIERDELWLYLRLEARHPDAFADAIDLMPQYVEIEGHPIVLCTLLDASGIEDASARVALDPRAAADRAVLERLAHVFRARLIRYAEDGSYVARTVRAPREEIVRAMIERAARVVAPSDGGAEAAMERVLAAPPPIGNESMPFGPARPLATPASARAAVASLTEWTHAERRDEAVFTYGVPPHVIEATTRHVLRAAAEHGIALLDRLEGLAVAHAIAPSREVLVRSQLDAFRRTVERGENDLALAETGANWTRLIAQATRLGVAPTAEARRAPVSGAPAQGVPASIAEWIERLADPALRERAIEVLCMRGARASLPAIVATLPHLAPEACLRAFAWVGVFGASARETLVACLAADSPPVRHGAACALGRLADAPAWASLAAQLDAEPTPLWQEIARVLADGCDPVLLALSGGSLTIADPERLVRLLAHLASRGLAQEIENMENTPGFPLAGSARSALAFRPEVEAEDRAVRSGAVLPEHASAARLSSEFYRAARELGG